jgi:hypothetical protein
LFTFSKKIHYQISQQTNDNNVLNSFHQLAKRTLFANEINEITFFTLFRQQSNDNILQISSSQKINVTRSIILNILTILIFYNAQKQRIKDTN